MSFTENDDNTETWTCDVCGCSVLLAGVGGDVAECPDCLAEEYRRDAEYEAERERREQGAQ